jgi:glyoxylase-like metal-dependent hydrolase (beta-lactamase superfamily II)
MLNTIRLTPTVTEIQVPDPQSIFRVFLIETEHGNIVVDAGVSAMAEHLVETIRPYDPCCIVLSENHWDHVDGLPIIKEKMPGLQVICHEKEAQGIPIPVDRLLVDQEYIVPGVRAIHVPGHSLGNIAILLEEEKTLIAGDSIFGAGDYADRLCPPPQRYSKDVPQAIESIRYLLTFDFNKLILSHGVHEMDNAKDKIAAIL